MEVSGTDTFSYIYIYIYISFSGKGYFRGEYIVLLGLAIIYVIKISIFRRWLNKMIQVKNILIFKGIKNILFNKRVIKLYNIVY